MSIYPIPDDVAAEIAEVTTYPLGAIQAYVDNQGVQLTSLQDWTDIEDDFMDAFAGEWTSEREWIEEYACEMGLSNYGNGFMPPEIVSEFVSWIDWDQIIYDFQCSGEYWWERAAYDVIYVFRAV